MFALSTLHNEIPVDLPSDAPYANGDEPNIPNPPMIFISLIIMLSEPLNTIALSQPFIVPFVIVILSTLV